MKAIISIILISLFAGFYSQAADREPVKNLADSAAPRQSGASDNSASPDGSGRPTMQRRLGDEIVVWVDELQNLTQPFKNPAKTAPGELSLFLDCRDTGLAPVARDEKHGLLYFNLAKTTENVGQWPALFKVQAAGHGVTVDIGFKGDCGSLQPATLLTSEQKDFIQGSNIDAATRMAREIPHANLVLIPYGGLLAKTFAIFLVLGTLVLTGWLVATTGLIRDSTALDETASSKYYPYSLGKFQMVWWFLVILCSYLYLWVAMGERDSLNNTVLTLLGISASVGVLSRYVEVLRKPGVTKSSAIRNFFYDILDDGSGVSPYRLQMFAWTLVLTGVYLTALIQTNSMPTLSETLLYLMGISSGAYVGFKAKEMSDTPVEQAP